MYWLIGHFPEFEHLEPDERRQVLSTIPWRTYPHLIGVSIFSGVIVGILSGVLVSRFGPAVAATCAVAGLVTGALLSYQGQLGGIRRSMRLTIARAFEGQRLPVCLFCGYDLRGATADTCPECGKGVVPNFPARKP